MRKRVVGAAVVTAAYLASPDGEQARWTVAWLIVFAVALWFVESLVDWIREGKRSYAALVDDSPWDDDEH